MKQYNRSDHDKREPKIAYVGLASVVERIHSENGLDWTDLVNDRKLGPKERRLFDNLCTACSLTEKQREAILLYSFDHYTLQEIAAKFGVSHPMVCKYIREGKFKIYPLLKTLAEAKKVTK